ncbi:MAG TPA: glycosyltransferase family 2 protein [Candidatus Saccharimonadales bacterium]|nr:glycosyltransferase family 2 protein [Candidatus Saccharimonadales bacterium]
MFNPCVVIPIYNHDRAIGAVVDGVLAQKLPCVLVDDGSGSACASVLDALAVATPKKITLLRHSNNRGKGAAVLSGVRYAAQCGYSHAVQIDADGQHRVADIQRFVEQAAAQPQAVIVGCPEYDRTVPALRLSARYLTHIWVSINTLSRQIKDSMCGFRVYPLAAIIELDRTHKLGERMNFDIEALVRLHWAGVKIINLPTPVSYPSDGISHFRGGLDNFLISRLHATLFFGMLVRSPRLVARKWGAR